MVRVTLPTLLLAGFAAVATARNCKDLTIPLSLSSVNTNFALKAPTSNIEVTEFILNLVQPSSNYASTILGSPQYANVTGNYSIAATYCEPSSGPGSILQVLIHGLAFDRSYWDFPAQNYNYSYVNAALARNHSVFFFDRLGLGQSSHGDPVNEIQAPLEVAALYSLTSLLRRTQVPGIRAGYDKIVHVGHSFGSVQAYALTAAHPEGISDGIVLTGWSKERSDFGTYFQLGGNFVEARKASPKLAVYPPGYIVAGDVTGTQTNFFAPGNFDPALLKAAHAAGQPAAIGEILTIGGVAPASNSFAGPVLVITGERDLPFCGGNCNTSEPSIPAQSNQSFTEASYFETNIVRGAGHGLNLEYSAQATYTSILDFLDKNVQS